MLSKKAKGNERMTATQTKLAATGARVAAIARSTETVSLDLLKAIDGTVDAMTGITKIVDGLVSLTGGISNEVNAIQVIEGEYLDADDVVIDTMARTADELKGFLTLLVRKRKAIDDDPRLHDHHCEALHDAYEGTINAVAELIETLESARAAIIAYDLKAEPRGGPEVFDTVNDLIANLRSE
jgi:hypothetical protein